MQQEHEQVQEMESSGQSHRLSIALAIGATIGLIGLILLLYGLFGKADYSRSDNININLWWGLLLLVFGLCMSVGGALSARRHTPGASTEAQPVESSSSPTP